MNIIRKESFEGSNFNYHTAFKPQPPTMQIKSLINTYLKARAARLWERSLCLFSSVKRNSCKRAATVNRSIMILK